MNQERPTRRRFLKESVELTNADLVVSQSTVSQVSAMSDDSKQDRGWQIGCYTRLWAAYDYHEHRPQWALQ